MASSRIQAESIIDGAPSPHWLIAYSGGLDSTALLHLACLAARQQPACRVRAVHVDHGLHADSEAWAGHCQRQAQMLGVDCEIRRVSVDCSAGLGLEAAARQARHRALEAAMQPGESVLLAHHQDDQAETLLLNLARGAGIDGLAGMPQSRRFGSGWLYRPLLGYPRAALQRWLEARDIGWIEDPSNADLSLDRNWIRHRVLPSLRQRWPACDRKLAESAGHAGAAAHALADTDRSWLPVLADGDGWSASALSRLDDAQLSRVLRKLISEAGHPVPGQAVMAQLIAMLRSQRPDAEHLVTWTGVEARRYRDTFYLLRSLPALPPQWAVQWSGEQPLILPADQGRLETTGRGQWIVRFAQHEDMIRMPGRPAKRLSRWCQEQGVAPWLRCRLPVVLREGRICSLGPWVVDREVAPEKLQWIHAIAGIPGV